MSVRLTSKVKGERLNHTRCSSTANSLFSSHSEKLSTHSPITCTPLGVPVLPEVNRM